MWAVRWCEGRSKSAAGTRTRRPLAEISRHPTYESGPFEVMYGLSTARVGEGHAVVDDPKARPGMGAQEIVDRLGWLKQQGVTMSAVPIPGVKDIAAYLDHAQWVIEEITPKLR